jgi:regulation of enolase protein 1 (concanavalin A-like superfamily)
MEFVESEAVTRFTDSGFVWLNNPVEWNVDDNAGELEGSGGEFEVTAETLTIKPPAFKDFWSRTYYTPLLIKANASAFLYTVPAVKECTLSIDFQYTPKLQFDQVNFLLKSSAPITLCTRLGCLYF